MPEHLLGNAVRAVVSYEMMPYAKGIMGTVYWWGFGWMPVPLHDRREHEGEVFYLVYWRESDGAMPNWVPEGKVVIEPDARVLTESELMASIDYPGTLDPKIAKTPEEIRKGSDEAFEFMMAKRKRGQ